MYHTLKAYKQHKNFKKQTRVYVYMYVCVRLPQILNK